MLKWMWVLPLLALGLRGQEKEYDSAWDLLRGEYDKNKDGKVEAAEYPRGTERFKNLDTNQDGTITEGDFQSARERGARPRGRGQGGRAERPEAPALGSVAPDFELRTLDGKSKVKLSSFKDQRPVALIFGSYT